MAARNREHTVFVMPIAPERHEPRCTCGWVGEYCAPEKAFTAAKKHYLETLIK